MDYKKVAGPLLISFSLHLLLLGAICYFAKQEKEVAAGRPGPMEFIAVDLVRHSTPLPKTKLGAKSNSPDKSEAKGSVAGAEGEGGSSQILRLIQLKLARYKSYPPLAKRKGMEGKPVVQFKIKSDGTLEYLKLANSSGHPVLDQAALKTVQRASPFPFYSEPIEVGLTYSLTEW